MSSVVRFLCHPICLPAALCPREIIGGGGGVVGRNEGNWASCFICSGTFYASVCHANTNHLSSNHLVSVPLLHIPVRANTTSFHISLYIFLFVLFFHMEFDYKSYCFWIHRVGSRKDKIKLQTHLWKPSQFLTEIITDSCFFSWFVSLFCESLYNLCSSQLSTPSPLAHPLYRFSLWRDHIIHVQTPPSNLPWPLTEYQFLTWRCYLVWYTHCSISPWAMT